MAIGKLTEYGANERDMKFSIAGSPLADFDCEIPLFGGGRVTSVCVYSGRFDKKPRGGIQDVSLALALELEGFRSGVEMVRTTHFLANDWTHDRLAELGERAVDGMEAAAVFVSAGARLPCRFFGERGDLGGRVGFDYEDGVYRGYFSAAKELQVAQWRYLDRDEDSRELKKSGAFIVGHLANREERMRPSTKRVMTSGGVLREELSCDPEVLRRELMAKHVLLSGVVHRLLS